MSDEKQQDVSEKHIAEIITFKLLGYTLILLGVAAIIGITWNIWDLYHYPDMVGYFARSLQDETGVDVMPVSLLKIAAWQIVIVLMLTGGKVAIWLIEAGQRLVNIK